VPSKALELGFVWQCDSESPAAMVVLNQGRGSFADALIAELGARAGCTRTLTFDQKTGRLPGIEFV
jgi:predicted nucleic-acid-binding protein